MSHDFDQTLRILTGAVKSLDPREFDALEQDAIATLVRGNKLVFSGLGKNVPICEKIVGTLNSVGLAAAFVHTNSAVHGDLGVVRDGDLVIILTKSGETVESVHLSRLLNKRNCTQWLLTFNRDSILHREIPKRVVLDLEHEGDGWNILPNNSTVLNLIVLQGLAMALVEHFGVPIDVLHANHPGGAIGAKLDAAELEEELDAAELDVLAGELEQTREGSFSAMNELVLSPLGHTWFLDLDGTLVKHNGHLTDGQDSLLPGADALLAEIPADDLVVIVTSRAETYREATERFLADRRIRYDHIIFDAPFGERIVVNDAKPSGLMTALALNGTRDQAPSLRVRVDESL